MVNITEDITGAIIIKLEIKMIKYTVGLAGLSLILFSILVCCLCQNFK